MEKTNTVPSKSEITPAYSSAEKSGKIRHRLSNFFLDRLSVKEPNFEAQRINERSYVYLLEDKNLLSDREYSGVIRYDPSKPDSSRGSVNPENVVEIPEQEAVERTREFLAAYIEKIGNDDTPSEVAVQLKKDAEYILENMTYITEQDVSEATAGLASYWKGFLDENSANGIILLTTPGKSSAYISEKILANLSEDDRRRVQNTGDLGFNLYTMDRASDEEYIAHVDAALAHKKVIIVDDWIATGRQVSHNYGAMVNRELASTDMETSNKIKQKILALVEIDTLIDDIDRLESVFTMNGDANVDGNEVPVKSYWAKKSDSQMTTFYNRKQNVHNVVTGAHSSTDDAFEVPVAEMVKVLEKEYGIPAKLPPLANIERSYRR